MIRQATRRWNIGRDIIAGVLLCVALFLPWNLYFGFGVPDSRTAVFAGLALATLLSLGSIAVTYLGCWRVPKLVDGLRLWLNVPYLLLVSGFAVFAAIQTVRYGGSGQVPGGMGPGSWLGTAGALLAAQPAALEATSGDHSLGGWLASARILGWVSIAGAGLSVLFNLYWRVRYAMTDSGQDSGLASQHVAIIATAVVYGAAAWVAVFVASRWIVQRSESSRVATIVLGMSTLIAGLLVWVLPIGRDIDEFHGIAQNTSTAGVGFEGYLLWAAAAAIFVAPTLRESFDTGAWLMATRNALSLIAVWCSASALMRVTDLTVEVVLRLRHPPYDSAAMIAFDVVTAVIAVWVRINLANYSLPAAAVLSMCALLFGFAVSRVVVGVGLAPRFGISQGSTALANPVYGNNLAQQITSTFDVVLCALALCSLTVAIVVVPRYRTTVRDASAPPPPRIFRAPRIFRTEDVPARHGRHET